MIVFPAIDLVAGKVVRLERGDRSRMKVYSENPAAVARDFVEQGATWLHVVDLSAAFEEDEAAREANSKAIAALCQVEGISIDVGGGVRSLERIDELARLGAKRIAMGTVLVRDELFAQAAAAQAGQVKVNGWREGVGASADEVVGRLSSQGFKHLVFTDIARDGMQTGIDVEAYRHIAQVAGFPVVASGGISSAADIAALAEAGDGVIEGCITGRALYEGAFALSEALAAAKGGTPC